ncbi:MAG: glycosyltransferase family 4 protein [Dongiaceae bacterium]
MPGRVRPLSIAFLDVHPWDYHAGTPWLRLLGGTQSAACYLATTLAARGHRVGLSTHTTDPGTHRGVECVGPIPGRDVDWLGRFDIVVVLGTGEAAQLRAAIPASTRLVLWTGFAPNLKIMQHLASRQEQAQWDGFVFCSIWQQRRYRNAFDLPAGKCRVLRYGAAPPFVELPVESRAPTPSPVFLQSSAPERGLFVLLDAWPAIRAALPGARLTVVSSRRPYFIDEPADGYRTLYARARAMDGVDYLGGLAQPELAARALRADGLLYPCTFPETGCIAAIEAMAAGLRVVTTTMAVLPETCAGYAALVERDEPPRLARNFAAAVIADWQRAMAEPDAFRAARAEQIRFVRAAHDWSRIATEWEPWLASIAEDRTRATQRPAIRHNAPS